MAPKELDELKRLGDELDDAPFVCGGSVDPLPRGSQAHGVTVCYRDSTNQLYEVSFPPQEPSDLDRLVVACAPATFGRGNQDVLDPTYRQAVKLDPSQFTTSFNLAEFPILAEVQRVIGGGTAGVRAILHKLNVYSTGGFFKVHRDTPRSSQCLGTIVVCLPAPLSGGELVVKSADGSFAHTFDWGVSTANGKVQWCAFYSDCEHEVLPVRSGHRVTLTYVIEHQPLQHPLILDAAQPFSALGDRLEALLKDPSFAPQGTKLGFGLRHQYIVSERTAGKASTDPEHVLVSGNAVAVPLMKGADRVLKETLDCLRLQYAFVPVYAGEGYRPSAAEEAREAASYAEDEEYYGETYEGAPVPAPTEWRFPFPTEENPQGEWGGDGEKWLYISDWNSYLSPVDDLEYCTPTVLNFSQLALHKAREIVWVVRPATFPYIKTSIQYGNEHTLGHDYAAACLIVYIPPSEKRGAKKETLP